MIRRIILVALVFGGTTIRAQVPVDQLAKPPADAQIFSIVSTAGTHGKAAIWTAPDGRSMSRESILLRGQVWETDQSVRLGSDGMLNATLPERRPTTDEISSLIERVTFHNDESGFCVFA